MYHILVANDTSYGPYTYEQVQELIRRDLLPSWTHLWKEGTDNWKPLRDFEEFDRKSVAMVPRVVETIAKVSNQLKETVKLKTVKLKVSAEGIMVSGAETASAAMNRAFRTA